MMFDTVDCRTMTDTSGAAKADRDRPAPVLDLVHLRTYTLGIADLEQEILGLFLGELPKSQSALHVAGTAKDWHMAAHTLKGSALAIGAKRLAAAGAKAEATDCNDAAARARVLVQVGDAIREIGGEISKMLVKV